MAETSLKVHHKKDMALFKVIEIIFYKPRTCLIDTLLPPVVFAGALWKQSTVVLCDHKH